MYRLGAAKISLVSTTIFRENIENQNYVLLEYVKMTRPVYEVEKTLGHVFTVEYQ